MEALSQGFHSNFKLMFMKKIVYLLFCLVLVSCTGYMEESIEEMKPAQARSAGTGLYSDMWGIQNRFSQVNLSVMN